MADQTGGIVEVHGLEPARNLLRRRRLGWPGAGGGDAGVKDMPVIRLSHLDEAERRAYRTANNKATSWAKVTRRCYAKR
jgi:hypothetical protein